MTVIRLFSFCFGKAVYKSASLAAYFQVKVKVIPAPMAHRAAPVSVSVAISHTSANAVKAIAGAGPLVAPRV